MTTGDSLRVGIVSGAGSNSDGGGWTFEATVSKALRNLASPDTFVWLDDAHEALLRAGQTETRGAPKRRRLFDWAGFRGRSIEGSQIDPDDQTATWNLVAAHHRIDIVWFMNPPGFAIDTPYIATVWDLEHRKQPYFPEVSISGWTWGEREREYQASLPRAAFVLTGTATGKREIEHFYRVSADRVRVLPFPVPPPACDGEPEVEVAQACDKAGDFIFYPAQYWPHKNHANLLLALKSLREAGRKISLVLTGGDKGNKAFIAGRIAELGLDDIVFDLGFVSRNSLFHLYRNAKALVFPTFFGPDNLPPLEAFAVGRPVVTSDIPGARDQLGDAALYFDPTRPEDIAAKITNVCDDAEMRHQIKRQGFEIAATRSPEAYVAQVQSLLDEFRRLRRCWGSGYTHT